VELRAENKFSKSYGVPPTDTVSTIGAGDNFNAGFIYGLIRNGITRGDIERGLTETQWDEVIGCAQEFSADCCKSIFNYVSKEFGDSKK
jgi:fructokinase